MTNNNIIRQFEFFNEISENLELCSQKILNIYDNYDQSIELKDDKSPLTEADLASNEHISDLLSSISAYPIISEEGEQKYTCLLYTSPSPRDGIGSRMPSSA